MWTNQFTLLKRTSGRYIAQCGWTDKAWGGCAKRPLKWIKFSVICSTTLWKEILRKRYKRVHDFRHWRSKFLYWLHERHVKFLATPQKKQSEWIYIYLSAEGDDISITRKSLGWKCSFDCWIHHLFQTVAIMKPWWSPLCQILLFPWPGTVLEEK